MELECLNEEQHWKNVFHKYDIDGDGKLSFVEFRNLIEGNEYKHVLPNYVVKEIFEKADHDNDGSLDFQEFHEMIMEKENHFAFSKLKRLYIQYVKFMVPPNENNTTDGTFEYEYSCWPPPIAMILISLLEIMIFTICLEFGLNAFIYDPCQRHEIWRFITYMLVHIGWLHLVINVLVQILLGVPLEMVHRGGRVLTVYLAGVAAASLGNSIVNPQVRLAGASGGVYSLMTAHLATIIMNWRRMTCPIIHFIFFSILICSDLGIYIYLRYVLNVDSNNVNVTQFSGGLAGLLVGVTALRHFQVTRTEKLVRRAAFIVYIGLMTFAIICNIVLTNYFPE